MSTLRAMMEAALALETEHIAAGHTVQPKIIAHDAAGAGHIIFLRWRDDADKQTMLADLRKTFTELDVVRYVHVNEVWMATHVRGAPRPSERPDRTEALMITGIEQTGAHSIVMCEITTDGKTRRLGEPQWDQMSPVSGGFVELLQSDTRH